MKARREDGRREKGERAGRIRRSSVVEEQVGGLGEGFLAGLGSLGRL
jgi:hypothetical protein